MANDVNNLNDKTANGLAIEAMVTGEHLTYMEACVQWMEENSLDVSTCQKFIPKAIIDKLMVECIEANMLRPSMSRRQTRATLDFLM